MQTHYLPTDLVDQNGSSWGKGSRVRFATKSNNRCIIFVHGFGGSATGTWLEFPTLLPMEQQARHHDLYFYGYDGKGATASYSSSEFYDFLDALNSSPSKLIINPSLPSGAPQRNGSYRYSQVTICAHSLGAIVSRLALLEAGKQTPPRRWLQNITLVLFAPAHMGASIIPLVSLALAGIKLPLIGSKTLEALLKFRMPVLSDLEPGSQTLIALEKDTERALGPKYTKNPHLKARVIHAQKDKIVRQNPFVRDYPMKRLAGKGHMDICKPNDVFRNPIDEILPFI